LPIFTPFILRADLLPVFYYPFLVNIAASIALAGICTVHCSANVAIIFLFAYAAAASLPGAC
jgi:hypothetical protein